MRSLITGASGFVGGHLIRHLIDSGDDVMACYYPHAPSADIQSYVPKSRYQQAELNICDSAQCAKVFSQYQPQIVYHLAGLSFVPQAEEDFELALRVNVYGAQNIIRICHQMNTGIKCLFVSSGEVYGKAETSELPLTEDSPLRPNNNYSLSKLMAELVAERYSRLRNVSVAIARPFNHIGVGQDTRFVASNFAYQLAQIEAGINPPQLRVGNLSAKRDFCDVRDMVRAYRLAALHGKGIYVFGSGKPVSIQDLIDELISISGLTIAFESDPARMRQGEISEVYAGIDKASRELGWSPEFTLRDTLKDIYLEMRQRVQSEISDS